MFLSDYMKKICCAHKLKLCLTSPVYLLYIHIDKITDFKYLLPGNLLGDISYHTLHKSEAQAAKLLAMLIKPFISLLLLAFLETNRAVLHNREWKPC